MNEASYFLIKFSSCYTFALPKRLSMLSIGCQLATCQPIWSKFTCFDCINGYTMLRKHLYWICRYYKNNNLD